jgi:hypothetical protein
LTVAFVVLVALEAGWRVVRDLPPGAWSERLKNLALLTVVIASAGGLGILVGGGAPADSLHYVYGAIAIFGLPLSATLTRRMSARRSATVVLVVALAVLVVLARLFQTG